MNFYKILKIKKLGRGSPDFWTRLFAKHTGGGSVKPVIVELTGRLPLFFRTSENKLRDWIIYGNNEPGKNLISVEDTTGHSPEVTITRQDEQTGSIEAATTSGTVYRQIYWYPEFEEGQTYILSCYVNQVNTNARICFRRKNGNQLIASAWFRSIGYKSIEITYTSEAYPGGVYPAVLLNAGEASAGEINISELMLRKENTSEVFEPYQIGVGENTEITGELPIDFRSNGDDLLGYKIYGTADEAGVQTESGEPAGYKIPLTVTNGTERKDTDIYIGDSKLGEAEYVDYGEQKIYKRILFMTHDDKHFITKDNKDFCLRRRGYSG